MDCSKLKDIAHKRGIRFAKLARLSGVNETTLYRMQNGKYDPRLSTIQKIATALNLTPLQLLTELAGGQPPPPSPVDGDALAGALRLLQAALALTPEQLEALTKNAEEKPPAEN